MAQCCGMVPAPVIKVYRLREARKRKLQSLKSLQTKPENSDCHLDEDDNDSGISIHGNGNNNDSSHGNTNAAIRSHRNVNSRSDHTGTNGSISSFNLSRTELITRLSSASLKNPAYIKAKILMGFKASRPGTELNVEKGEIVYLLYREQDNVLVVNSEGKRGFVPLSYCSSSEKKRMTTSRIQNQLQNDPKINNFLTAIDQNIMSSTWHTNSRLISDDFQRELPNLSSSSEEDSDFWFRGTSGYPDVKPNGRKSPLNVRERPKTSASFFDKVDNTKMNVLYDFIARDENDISVYKGETITVLNREDSDWWWVVTPEGYEGFVPKCYLTLATNDSSEASTTSSSMESSSSTSEGSSTQVRFQEPLCTFHRYETEEWETELEIHAHIDDYPADKIQKESGRQDLDQLRWSTWC